MSIKSNQKRSSLTKILIASFNGDRYGRGVFRNRSGSIS